MSVFNRQTLFALMAAAAMLVAGERSALAQAAAGDFDAAQQDAIGKIAAQYLIDHPEVLVQVSQALQQKQQQQQTEQMLQGAIKSASELTSDAATPATGPKNAKVAVVQFFDYQCIYCFKMSSAVEQLMEKNENVRFVFKEFPIFGSRWPASTLAAEAGLQVFKSKGADAYVKYHNGLYATGKNEGKLTGTDIEQVAKTAGVSLDDVKKNADALDTQLQKHMTLGSNVGVSGTPTFIVLPIKGANADNVTVVPGAADLATLQQAIDKASK
ncbi:DsbA family protein [Pseudomonas matsuisoli]|uniref:DSBA oxidoreductase n=1 Tax=Pseudomonas matsuisoli TaxID=1515666 RepID=A0A917PYZ4_9PSED|nr:DsbA family protein [Pseudomonas matsuisoli]GGK00780.1 DSBA oxidoreductase [Pseudomonas matsuisoli]